MNFSSSLKLTVFLLILGATTALAQTSWKGTTSTNWYDAANWTAGVPATNTDVIIGDANFTGAFQPFSAGSVTATCRSLTVGGAVAATLTVKYTLTAYSNVIIAANGTLIHNTTKSLTVKGNWSNSGSYIASNTSAAVAFGGTTNQTISGTANFAKLTISSGSVTTLTTNVVVTNLLTVSGTLNPNESPTYTVTGAGKLTISGTLQVRATTFPGNYSLANTVTVSAGSTVEYAATNSNQTVAGNFTYSTLRISGTNTVKSLTNNLTPLNAASSSRGLLYLASGTLDLGDFTANRGTTTNGGTLTLINGAKLRLTGTNNFPTNYTTYTINSGSTVEYAGTNQLIVAKTYGHLLLTNSVGAGTKTFPATNFTIAGNLIAGAAGGATVAFTAGSNLTVSGSVALSAGATFNGSSFTLTNSGNWTNNGTFTGSSSTVVMNGASTRFAGSGTNNFFNLTIAKAGVTNTADTSLTVAGDFNAITSATFVHAPGGTGSVTLSGAGKTIYGAGTKTFSTLAASGTITTTNSLTIAGDLNVTGSFSATANPVTLSGTNKSIFGGGTVAFTTLSVPGVITTTNNFSLTSSLTIAGSLTATAGTAAFLGTTTLSGTANLFNGTLNGTKLQLGANSILGIAGALTLTAGTFDVTTTTPNTVNFNGAGAQTINAGTYNQLMLSTGGTKTAAGALTNNSDLTINSGATFAAGAFSHSLSGNFINNGTFTAGSGTVQLLGSANAYISGATMFNTLVVNKSTSSVTVNLSNHVSVATLNFTNGLVQTLASALTITSTRTGGGLILGTITRTHTFANGTAYAFEGTNNTVNFASGAGNVNSMTVNVTVGSISDFPFGGSVNRQYTVTPTASGAYAATLRLHYNDSELNGNTESSMQLWRNTGSSWAASGKTANDTANNYVEQSSLSDVSGRWTFSDNNNVALWNGSVSTAWETAANWTIAQGAPSLPPGTNDIVELGQAAFTSQPAISSAASVKSITFGSAQAVTLTVNPNGSLATIGNISGSWTNSATHTIELGNQTLTIGGSLALSDGTNSHAINVTASNAVVNLTGSLTESGGANITFTGAGALNLGGDFSYTSGTFTPGSSTFTYNGSGAQAVGGVTYNQLTFNKSGGTATLGAAATANGNLIITNAAALTVNAALTVATNVVINPGATLTVGSATISVGGNWTNTGTFTAGTGTVLFNGTGTQNNVGTNVFNHFTVNKSAGILTLVSNISLNGNMTISAGTLDLGAFTANRSALGGTLTLSSGATLKLASTFPANFSTRTLAAGSTVEYNGTNTQTVSAETYGNLTLTNGNAVVKTLAGAATLVGDFVIHTNATFDASAFALTVSGNWTNNGTFTPNTSAVTLSGAAKTLSGATTFNQFTVSGNITAVSNITVNSTFTLSGSFTTGNTTNIFNGDFANTGTFANSGRTTFSGTNAQTLTLDAGFTSTGTVLFGGTNALTFLGVTSPNFQNLAISNNAGITPVSGWNVNGDFGVVSGATFTGGAFTHNFSGNFTNLGTFTSSGVVNFTPTNTVGLSLRGTSFNSSGTVTFGGSGQISIFGSAPVLDYIVIANTHAAGITPSANWNLADDLMINSGSIFNGGTFTHTISGDWINNGTFSGGTSTIKFNSATLIGGTGATTFNHLLITGNATNAADFSLVGSFTNNGTFDAQGFTVTFNGASGATLAGSTTPTPFDTLVIAKTSATVTQAVNVTASANLTISGGTLDTTTFILAQQTSGGTLSATAGATLKIGGANSFPAFDTVSLDSASTVEYNGTSAQTIGAQSYGNLTSSSTGARTLTNTVNITGTFTPGANSYTVTNSTVNFNGASAQTIPAFNFHHLSSSSVGARTLANSGTVGVGGVFTPGANSYTATGNTVSFNSGSAQTIPVFNYNNLTTAGSGTKTLAGSLTVSGNLSLGSTLADGGFVLTVNGDAANTATHTGAGEILLSGGSTNHVVTGGGAFQNLELSDTNGATLSATNLNVNGTLTLTAGKISTSTNKVILAAAASLSRTNGYVIGWLQKPIATGAVRTNLFELGDTTTFAPVGVVFSNVTVAGAMLATVTTSDHGDIANSGIAAARSVNRYWTLTNNTATFGTASATFNFVTNDLDAEANSALFLVAKKSGGVWTLPAVGAITATNFTATGLTNFGDFQIGESSITPSITSQPSSVRVNIGLPASFSVTASGAPMLTYQWRQNGTNVSGATNATLNFASTIDTHAGNYTLILTNGNGAVTSSIVTLTLNHEPSLAAITTQTFDEQTTFSYTNSTSD
ncbi:MAG: hypothetical protein RL380_847, partial [Verrucomicrobiota bacterium]